MCFAVVLCTKPTVIAMLSYCVHFKLVSMYSEILTNDKTVNVKRHFRIQKQFQNDAQQPLID